LEEFRIIILNFRLNNSIQLHTPCV